MMYYRVVGLVLVGAVAAGCGESTSGDGGSEGGTGASSGAGGTDGTTSGSGGTSGAAAGSSAGTSGAAGSNPSGGSSGSAAGGASAGDAGIGGAVGGTTGGGGSGGGPAGEGGGGGADCGCVDEELTWGRDGGLVVYIDQSSLSPCAEFTQARRTPGTADPTTECTQEVPRCGGGVTAEAIAEALAHPDVVAARASAPVLYGTDPRAYDGQVMRMSLAGDIVEVGGDCAGSTDSCTTPPSGVTTLAELLRDLTAQELARGQCTGVFD